jgi:hypothetical protein
MKERLTETNGLQERLERLSGILNSVVYLEPVEEFTQPQLDFGWDSEGTYLSREA